MKGQRDGVRIRPCLLPVVNYLFLLVFLVCWYFFLKSHLLMTTVVVMLILPFCSIGSAWWMRQHLSVRVYAMQPVMREGQEGFWRVSLVNDSYGLSLACTVFATVGNAFLGTSGEIQLKMPVSMKYTEYMDLPFTVEFCGLLRVGVQGLEYRDPMGLVRIRMPLQAVAESVVLPNPKSDLQKHREGYQAGITEAEETLSKGFDFSEVTDMREYRPGDRIKDIHWKLSAKTRELMVKERASVAQSQVVLLLDLSDGYKMVSQILGLAYGVTQGFLETYVPVRILWWDEDRYNFQEILIAEMDSLESGFGKLLHSHVCRMKQDLPELMQRIRPTLHSYVYLHAMQGSADGEVITHV